MNPVPERVTILRDARLILARNEEQRSSQLFGAAACNSGAKGGGSGCVVPAKPVAPTAHSLRGKFHVFDTLPTACSSFIGDCPRTRRRWRPCRNDYGHRWGLSLIHISEPTRLLSISYAVFCL